MIILTILIVLFILSCISTAISVIIITLEVIFDCIIIKKREIVLGMYTFGCIGMLLFGLSSIGLYYK